MRILLTSLAITQKGMKQAIQDAFLDDYGVNPFAIKSARFEICEVDDHMDTAAFELVYDSRCWTGR